MKPILFLLPALAAGFGGGWALSAVAVQAKDPPPPVFVGQTPPAPKPAAGSAQSTTAPQAATPAGTPAPPPSSSAKRSAAELEKLVAPLALFPDPLIATMLPASVYPLEIVQAARFVANTNNLSKLEEQPWDENVKAVARIPDAIKKMNDDLSWTVELGDAFLAQDKDVMDAIQNLRAKAKKAGTLQTTPQQVVVVTNLIVTQTNATQVVTVTNQIVQIQPSNPSVVYVPTYNPTTVYYPPPAYVYDPIAPLVTFTAGVAMGAIIANNCDWWHGGCYHGDVDVDIDRNVNRNVNRNTDRAGTGRTSQTGARASTTQKKWQPDQGRLRTSGSSGAAASARTSEARGWGSGSGGARPSTQPGAAARPSAGNVGARPSAGTPGARPSTGTPSARPSTGTPSANRPSPSQGANRPTPSAGASANRSAASANRPSSSGSAFSGVNSGSGAARSSSRGASSRGGGFGGGGRGGGGRR